MKLIQILLLSLMLYSTPILAMQEVKITWDVSLSSFDIESKGNCGIAIDKDEKIMSFKKKINDKILQDYKEKINGDKESLKHFINGAILFLQPNSPETIQLRYGSFNQSFNEMGLTNYEEFNVTYKCSNNSSQKVAYYVDPKKDLPPLQPKDPVQRIEDNDVDPPAKDLPTDQQNDFSLGQVILIACLTFFSLTGLYFLKTHPKKRTKKVNKKVASKDSVYEIIHF